MHWSALGWQSVSVGEEDEEEEEEGEEEGGHVITEILDPFSHS